VGRGKAGAAQASDHLGQVQIDTISVVERAHHHDLVNTSGRERGSRWDWKLATHVLEMLSRAGIVMVTGRRRELPPSRGGFARLRGMLAAVLLAAFSAPGGAQPVQVTDQKDQAILRSFLAHVSEVPESLSREHCQKLAADEVEEYTWELVPQLRMPLTAYRITGDPGYLDIFVRAFENMRLALTRGPDGFLGWYGKALPGFEDPAAPDRKVDVVVNSFSVAEVVSEFLELAGGEPELSSKYAAQRAEYLDLLENHLVKKWDVRGNYVDLAQTGAIYRAESGMRETKALLTLPHNKQSIVISGLLALYRVTGNDEYMRRAIKLGTRFKHCLLLKDGHYEWSYWDPAGEWDINPSNPAVWKHGIWPEHQGSYYSLTLAQATTLYDYGVVFDRHDIDRFLRTQLDVCWNGDFEHPVWTRVDGSRPAQYTLGEYISYSLAPFEERIARFLYWGGHQDDRVRNAEHSWQGGPVAGAWLEAKLLAYPAAKGGRQAHLDAGRRFLAKVENRAFLAALAFDVTESGYAAPKTPADMEPMPHASQGH
jgi:hypothetical protein